MGSFSASTSNATDNRQAITDQALGVSSSGNGNNVALSGHIFNIGSTSGANRNTQAPRQYLPGNFYRGGGFYQTPIPEPAKNEAPIYSAGTNINILDSGAINKSFDFAAFSLSEMLGAIVGSNKQTAAQLAGAQVQTMETIGGAIQQAGTVTAQAAQQAAETSNKGLLIIGGAVAVWWFFIRGKK